MKGFVQCYTGNGKGKTTAAIGLAIRAAGWGKHSIIVQFLKGVKSGEQIALKRFNDLITIVTYGSKNFYIPGNNDAEYKSLVHKAYNRCMEACGDSSYEIIICDEILTALHFKLITIKDIITLIQTRPYNAELILTGRYLPKKLHPYCDLITEMNDIKHYYEKGIKARKGIEW
ncbi:MAG: cob(I)yrinic acid a,c-diamide adenosyltransferase [Spirochaetota bacterium]